MPGSLALGMLLPKHGKADGNFPVQGDAKAVFPGADLVKPRTTGRVVLG